MRPAVFLDRDGTIVSDVGYLHRVEDLQLLPGAGQAIARLNRAGFLVLVVTNQSGVARGYFDLAAVERVHAALAAELAGHGAHVDRFYSCPYHPDFPRPELAAWAGWRKPDLGMFAAACRDFAIDVAASAMVGDASSDLEFARAAGLAAHHVRPGHGLAEAVDAIFARA